MAVAAWAETPVGCRVTFEVNDGPDCRCAWKVGTVFPNDTYTTEFIEVCADMSLVRFDTYIWLGPKKEELVSAVSCEYLPTFDEMDCVTVSSTVKKERPRHSRRTKSEQRDIIKKAFPKYADYLLGETRF